MAATSSIPSLRDGPLTRSYTWASAVPTQAQLPPESTGAEAKGAPCLMGIDEAGRGPALGPMVYGVAYAPISYASELKEIGFADSKALTPERRDALLRGLIENPDHIGWAVRVISPQDISAGMLRRHPYNLNSQALDATVELIQNVLDSGVDLTEIYVDTLGKAETHSKNLQSHFPRHKHIKWTVTSKADAIYPIVGAASIAAKVTRDRILEGWVYREPGLGRVLMLAPEKVGRGEWARGSTVGLLGGMEDEHLVVEDLPDEQDGDGDVQMVEPSKETGKDSADADEPSTSAASQAAQEPSAADADASTSATASAAPTVSVPDLGPAAGAGKRKRTASTKLIELVEVEADMALKRTMRKTAQLRAAVARQTRTTAKGAAAHNNASAASSSTALTVRIPNADGLTQSPNPAFANVGSGYPSDPNTLAFLKATLDPIFGWPGIARFSWGTIRTMLEPAAASKKGGGGARPIAGLPSTKAKGSAKGKGKASAGGRSLRSGGELEESPLGEVAEDEGSLVLKAPKHGYAVRWADEQREAASAAITSISKFFAPVASSKKVGSEDAGRAGTGGGWEDEGPLGRVTIARLENQELRKARVSMWKDLGLAPVGSAAFDL
ncbi:hypothetical protein V8E36_007323 [Tilletia maclaganii]